MQVIAGSPAATVDLQPSERTPFGQTVVGDLIVAVGATPITSNEDLLCAVEEAEPGRPLQLTVAKGGDTLRRKTLTVTPAARKDVREMGRAAVAGGVRRWGRRR